jgi:hypothetical protein
MSPNFTLPKAKVYLKKIQTQCTQTTQVALLLSSFARHNATQTTKIKKKGKEKREKRERGAVFFAWSFFEFCVLRFASRARSRSEGVRFFFLFGRRSLFFSLKN